MPSLLLPVADGMVLDRTRYQTFGPLTSPEVFPLYDLMPEWNAGAVVGLLRDYLDKVPIGATEPSSMIEAAVYFEYRLPGAPFLVESIDCQPTGGWCLRGKLPDPALQGAPIRLIQFGAEILGGTYSSSGLPQYLVVKAAADDIARRLLDCGPDLWLEDSGSTGTPASPPSPYLRTMEATKDCAALTDSQRSFLIGCAERAPVRMSPRFSHVAGDVLSGLSVHTLMVEAGTSLRAALTADSVVVGPLVATYAALEASLWCDSASKLDLNATCRRWGVVEATTVKGAPPAHCEPSGRVACIRLLRLAAQNGGVTRAEYHELLQLELLRRARGDCPDLTALVLYELSCSTTLASDPECVSWGRLSESLARLLGHVPRWLDAAVLLHLRLSASPVRLGREDSWRTLSGCFREGFRYFESTKRLALGLFAPPSADSRRARRATTLLQRLRLRLILHALPEADRLRLTGLGWCQSQQLRSHFIAQKAIRRSALMHGGAATAQGQPKQRRPLEAWLDEAKDVVVLGEPGAGKTWGLARFAHEQFRLLAPASGELPSESARIVLYASASEVLKTVFVAHPGEGLSSGALLEAMLRSHPILSETILEPIAGRTLLVPLAQVGAFVCIIDGINEVPLEDRPRLAALVDQLRAHFPHNRLIVSGRTRQWNDKDFKPFDRVVEVQPLTLDEAYNFVSAEFATEGTRASHLLRLLGLLESNNPRTGSARPPASISSLAQNPFFLDKIIRVFRARLEGFDPQKGDEASLLPRNRGDLFRDYIRDESKDCRHFELQKWLLSVLGLHLTFIQQTNLSDVAVDVLFVAFCVAPRELLTASDDPLFQFGCVAKDSDSPEPDTLARWTADEARPADGMRIWDRPEGQKLLERFSFAGLDTKEEVLRRFDDVMTLVLKNAFLECVGNSDGPTEGPSAPRFLRSNPQRKWAFGHQSIQEYFAAERLAQVHREDPRLELRSEAPVPDYLRLKRYDDMLHILLGCVFRADQSAIRILRYMLVRGSRFADVSVALSKAEHIEEEAARELRELCIGVTQISDTPDELRAEAARCLPYLRTKPEHLKGVLERCSLGAGTKCWTELHNVFVAVGAVDGVLEEIKAGLRFVRTAPGGGVARYGELLAASAKWATSSGEVGHRLYRFLEDNLLRWFKSGEAQSATAKEIWQVLRGTPDFPSSLAAWNALLEHAPTGQLYAEVLRVDLAKTAGYLADRFAADSDVDEEIRQTARYEDWFIAAAALLEICRNLGLSGAASSRSAVLLCKGRAQLPDGLLQRLLEFDLDVILSGEVDSTCWSLVTDGAKIPSSAWQRLKALLPTASPEQAALLARGQAQIERFAITPEKERAELVCSVVVPLATAAAAGGLATPLATYLADTVEGLAAALEDWDQLTEERRRALQIAVRERRQQVNADAVNRFWLVDRLGRLNATVFMGGHGDLFLRESLDDLRFAVGMFGIEERLDDETRGFIRRLSESGCDYSTRITVFTVLLGSPQADMCSGHPGNPGAKPGSPSFASLLRLLRNEDVTQAAYMLVNHESTWPEAQACIEKEHPDLLPAFLLAEDKTGSFEDDDGSHSTGTISDGLLLTEEGLQRLNKTPRLLKPEQLDLLLDYIRTADDGEQLQLAVSGLRRSRVWTGEARRPRRATEALLDDLLRYRLLGPESTRVLRACRALETFRVALDPAILGLGEHRPSAPPPWWAELLVELGKAADTLRRAREELASECPAWFRFGEVFDQVPASDGAACREAAATAIEELKRRLPAEVQEAVLKFVNSEDEGLGLSELCSEAFPRLGDLCFVGDQDDLVAALRDPLRESGCTYADLGECAAEIRRHSSWQDDRFHQTAFLVERVQAVLAAAEEPICERVAPIGSKLTGFSTQQILDAAAELFRTFAARLPPFRELWQRALQRESLERLVESEGLPASRDVLLACLAFPADPSRPEPSPQQEFSRQPWLEVLLPIGKRQVELDEMERRLARDPISWATSGGLRGRPGAADGPLCRKAASQAMSILAKMHRDSDKAALLAAINKMRLGDRPDDDGLRILGRLRSTQFEALGDCVYLGDREDLVIELGPVWADAQSDFATLEACAEAALGHPRWASHRIVTVDAIRAHGEMQAEEERNRLRADGESFSRQLDAVGATELISAAAELVRWIDGSERHCFRDVRTSFLFSALSSERWKSPARVEMLVELFNGLTTAVDQGFTKQVCVALEAGEAMSFQAHGLALRAVASASAELLSDEGASRWATYVLGLLDNAAKIDTSRAVDAVVAVTNHHRVEALERSVQGMLGPESSVRLRTFVHALSEAITSKTGAKIFVAAEKYAGDMQSLDAEPQHGTSSSSESNG